jgi:hypothetical protein
MDEVYKLYNQLPIVQKANRTLKKFDRLDEMWAEIASLLDDYDDEDFGVCLVHSHSGLTKGEIMLHRQGELVSEPTPGKEGIHQPERWVIVIGDTEGEMELKAYEFCEMTDEGEIDPPSNDLVQAFRAILAKHKPPGKSNTSNPTSLSLSSSATSDLSDSSDSENEDPDQQKSEIEVSSGDPKKKKKIETLGLFYSPYHDGCLDSPSEIFRECTHARTNYRTIVDASTKAATSSIDTEWILDESSDDDSDGDDDQKDKDAKLTGKARKLTLDGDAADASMAKMTVYGDCYNPGTGHASCEHKYVSTL